MSYASLQQLTDRFGEKMIIDLTDRSTPRTNEVDQDVVDRALADTDAQIDGYLASRYKLPLTETPALITDLAITISIYKLHRLTPNDKIKEDYNQAIRTLRDISAGVVRLGVAGIEPPASGANGVRTTDRGRDMTPDNLKGFV